MTINYWNMQNLKNIALAYLSTLTCFAAAVETGALVSIISTIVLPVVFFTVGKIVDVLVRLYLIRRSADHQR